MSFLDGIADAIGGSSDPSTEDQTGLTQADRRRVLFGGLTNMGAMLLAAGQPMYGNERARYLAQLGNVPAQMQQQAFTMQQQKLLNMKTQQAQIQMQQAARERQILGSPEFQQQLGGLDPSTSALLKAAAAGGDMGTIAKIYDSMQPKMSYSGVVFDPRRGLVIDPYSGMRVALNGGTATTGDGFFPYKRTPGLAPTDVDTQLLNSLPPQIKTNVTAWLQGKRPVPTSSALRDPRIQQQLTLAQMVDPGFDAASYPARAAFLKNMSSGQYAQTVDSANKFLNHAARLLKAYDQLGLYNGSLANLNGVILYGMQAKHDPRVQAVNSLLSPVLDEFAKFMGGKGQLTDAARKEYEDKLKMGRSPEEIHAALSSMIDLMQGQLKPIAERRQEVMRNPNSQPLDFIQPDARKSLDFINSYGEKTSGPAAEVHSDATQAAGAAAPASAPSSTEQPPVAGARKARDGHWYVPDPNRPGKYLMVQP